jgi:glutathionylspermidine synthase
MLRHSIEPRPDWQRTVESQGMLYHTADGVPYWDESAYYEFTAAEIDALEAATYQLDKMCLAAVEHVVHKNDFQQFLIPERYWEFIHQSWERDEHTIYGRFDLAFDGLSPPKLLEYNADTPTALLEAAVVQWFWLKDRFPDRQQFNSIHDRLLEVFRALRQETSDRFYFSALAASVEDRVTVNYLRDVAIQAGFATAYLDVEQIGWHERRGLFTDVRENPICLCFTLYPWEWMLHDEFGPHLLKTRCRWFEPPWKALLSNKAILAVLWELYPGNPYLLEASLDPPSEGDYVKKPVLGREGANVQVFHDGKLSWQSEGPYDGPAVYQELWPLPRFDEKYYPVIGSWIVNGWSCGVGIREDASLVTGNLSRFLPHLYRP